MFGYENKTIKTAFNAISRVNNFANANPEAKDSLLINKILNCTKNKAAFHLVNRQVHFEWSKTDKLRNAINAVVQKLMRELK